MFNIGTLKKFLNSKRGNVTMIFALSMVPMIAIAGFAIDAQLAFSKKEKIQYALDSAVLAGARKMQRTNDQAEVLEHSRAYFGAMMDGRNDGLRCEDMTLRFDVQDELKAEVDCWQPTTLMRIIGRNDVKIHSTSTATYGIGKLDVAFVFDISGSMNSYGRIFSLKTAAEDAAETLLPAPGSAGDGDVRIAMVAYNSMVNAGDFFEEVTGLKPRRTYTAEVSDREKEYYDEEYTDWERECERTCTRYAGKSGRCKKWDYDCEWVEVTKTRRESRWVETTRTETYTLNSTCVYERDGDHAFDDTQPTQLASGDLVDELEEGSYHAGENGDNQGAYMTAAYAYWDAGNERWRTNGTDCLNVKPFELSSDADDIEDYIEDLYANGGTAGHQGVAWGWYLLSEEWSDVFDGDATPLPYNQVDATKAMIIMTDGEFNSQFHGSQGNSTQQAKDLCDEIKEKDVVIYTVAFQAPSAGEEVLAYCASGVEFAFKASNGQELLDSYQAIATSISDLRIAH